MIINLVLKAGEGVGRTNENKEQNKNEEVKL